MALTDPVGILFAYSEFQPGVPWKGVDRIDPESDPYMTPGSMMGNAVSPNLNDTEHQLLRDNSGKHLPTDNSLSCVVHFCCNYLYFTFCYICIYMFGFF